MSIPTPFVVVEYTQDPVDLPLLPPHDPKQPERSEAEGEDREREQH